MSFLQSQSHQSNATHRDISSTFLGRVVMLFGVAIGISALGAYIGFTNMASFTIKTMPAYMMGAMIAELVLIFTARWWSTMRPLNYVFFAAFAFVSGFTVAPILYSLVAQGSGEIVYRALTATMVTFVAAGLVAWKTEIDMFRFQGFLTMSLIGMLIVGVLGIFFPFGSMMESIYSFFGIILFIGYTMFDLQRLRFNATQNEIEIALAIYLDIFNLFLFILRFLSRGRN